MANQGLKSYVKTLKQEIGVVKGNINLNGDCGWGVYQTSNYKNKRNRLIYDEE